MLWLTLKQLRSRDYDRRSRAFAKATRNRDVDALLQVIEDADEYLRQDAIKALGEIGDPKAVPALIKRLDDANFNNQENAAEALARIGDGRAARPLVAMLRAPDKHPQTRSAAVKALTTLADPRTIPDLVDALGDRDRLSRYLSLQVLAVVGDGRAVPATIAALRDPDSDIRWQAVETLGALRDPRAGEPLLGLLTVFDDHKPGPPLYVIIKALGRIGDRRAEASLVAVLSQPEKSVRDAAAVALDALGWQPADDDVRVRYYLAQERWDELAGLGWERAHQPLSELLQNGDRDTRLQAVEAIDLIGEPLASEPLILALDNEDEGVVAAAASVLARIGGARAVKPLIAHSLRYSPKGNYWNDPTIPRTEQRNADEWVKPLEALIKRSAVDIAPEDLHQLADLGEKTYHLCVNYDTPGYGDGVDGFVVTLDFSRVRNLAEKELSRRSRDS
jgi:HEAT repeat protein